MPINATFKRSGVYVRTSSGFKDLIYETSSEDFVYWMNSIARATANEVQIVDDDFPLDLRVLLMREFYEQYVDFDKLKIDEIKINQQEYSEFEKRILEERKSA